MKDSNMVQSVVRALKIYEKLVYEDKPLSLSYISDQLDLNISTVHRLINTLLNLGYVEQNDKGKYMPGSRSYEISREIKEGFNLKKLARPYLEEIVKKYNETCNLVILEDKQVKYIDQVESTNMVRMFAGIDSTGPAYCTGSGKALLAFLSKEEIDDYLANTEFVAYTESTLTDPDNLKKELMEIREQGYALDREEREKGVRCVAAPLLDNKGSLVAAISVSGPRTRITDKLMKNELIPLVKNKARQISRQIP